MVWHTVNTPSTYDVLAPDGSEIRLLASVSGGSMVHCRLQPGQVTQAVRHQSVEELWYCLSGTGQLWRERNDSAEIVDLEPGVAISVPLGVAFQFRCVGDQTLDLVITTMPPWPGPHEAVVVDGPWPVAQADAPST